VPSTSAIDGFVKLSQLGAPLAAARSELFTLCALAVFYNLIALSLMVRNTKPIMPMVSESAF
jgi:ABC-2 type transport system permease protein